MGVLFLFFKTSQITLISLVWKPLLENEVKMQRPIPSLWNNSGFLSSLSSPGDFDKYQTLKTTVLREIRSQISEPSVGCLILMRIAINFARSFETFEFSFVLLLPGKVFITMILKIIVEYQVLCEKKTDFYSLVWTPAKITNKWEISIVKKNAYKFKMHFQKVSQKNVAFKECSNYLNLHNLKKYTCDLWTTFYNFGSPAIALCI